MFIALCQIQTLVAGSLSNFVFQMETINCVIILFADGSQFAWVFR